MAQPDLAKFVRDVIDRRLRGIDRAGVAVSVTDRSETLAVVTLGYANREARTELTRRHLFQIGSIGKSFTAVALLQLAEEGRLDVHAPVTEYVPWFSVRSRYEPITVHHLLTHTAGIVAGSDVTSDSEFDVWALRESEAGSSPGSHYRYSNVGYRTLGLVLAALDERPYADTIRERILQPLGMESTEPVITNHIRHRSAVGYQTVDDDVPFIRGAPLVPAPWIESGTGDGAVSSTPDDMAAYVRMHLNEGLGPHTRVLSRSSVRLMQQPFAATAEGGRYGYGIRTWQRDGRDHFGHAGGMVGYWSDMRADSDAGVAVVVLVNAPEFERIEGVADDCLDAARAAVHGRPMPRLPDEHDPLRVASAADYEGLYRATDGATVRVIANGEHLFAETAAGRDGLEPRAKDQFQAAVPEFARFRFIFRRENDRVDCVDHGSKRFFAAEPPGHAPEPATGWTQFEGRYRSYNPWTPNIRVYRRADGLFMTSYPWGEEDALVHLGGATFRVGADERSPERLRFDAVVNGRALRVNLSGCDYYRALTGD